MDVRHRPLSILPSMLSSIPAEGGGGGGGAGGDGRIWMESFSQLARHFDAAICQKEDWMLPDYQAGRQIKFPEWVILLLLVSQFFTCFTMVLTKQCIKDAKF